MALHIERGTAAPTGAPVTVGEHFVDTLAEEFYMSKGTAATADWKLLLSVPVTGSYVRIYGGRLQVQNEDTGLWHSLRCRNSMEPGIIEFYPDQNGVA